MTTSDCESFAQRWDKLADQVLGGYPLTDDDALEVLAIHDEAGYRNIRRALVDQYNLSSREPNIQVHNVARRGDRSLTLRHLENSRRPLDESADEVLRHLTRLWGFDVRLESVREDGHVELAHECKAAAD